MRDLFSPPQLPRTVLTLLQSLRVAQNLPRAHSIKVAVHGAEVVTQSDAHCEMMVAEALGLAGDVACPTIGEETTPSERTIPANFRTHDPIDGTNAYASHSLRWGTLFSEFHAYQPECGIGMLADGERMVSFVRARKESLMWRANGDSVVAEPLHISAQHAQKLIFFPGYLGDECIELIEAAAHSCGLTLFESTCSADALFALCEGKGCAVFAPCAKIWDMGVLATYAHMRGGITLDLETGTPLVWNKVSTDALLGVSSPQTYALFQALRNVPITPLPPAAQWVPR